MRRVFVQMTAVVLAFSASAQSKKGTASSAAGCHDAVGCFAECDRGVATSCEVVGGMFENGIGVEASQEKALEFYQRACRGGDKRACHKKNVLSSREPAPAAAPPEKKPATPAPAEAKKEVAAKEPPATGDARDACLAKCQHDQAKCLSKVQLGEGDPEAALGKCAKRASKCKVGCGADEDDETEAPSPGNVPIPQLPDLYGE